MSYEPQQPKLRSSCDRCGAAKVKCDRRQPECGRCISHGMPCVYGVSRKLGKPPRRPSLSRTLSRQHAGYPEVDSGNIAGGSHSMLDLEMLSAVSDISVSWDAMDHQSTDTPDTLNLMGHLHANSLDSLYQELAAHPPPLPDFFSPNPHDVMAIAEHSTASGSLPSTAHPSGPTSGAHSPNVVEDFEHDPQLDEGGFNFMASSGSSHNCPRAAKEILQSLLCLNGRQNALPPTPPRLTPVTTTGAPTDDTQVPLDLVLRLNREAAERLIPLLSCHCARLPHLALLYASIISRMLTWYQQAAGCCIQSPPPPRSQSPGRTHTDTPPWPSEERKPKCSTSTLGSSSRSSGLSVTPARMVIGTFNVDDSRLQNAMKIQLLSGEMRRVGALIEKFSAGGTESQRPGGGDEYDTFGNVETLYQSLSVWLERDHSRVAHMLKAELRELNN